LLEHVFETLKRKNILYIRTLFSTQLYAQSLLSKIKPIEGSAILTYNQTDGRGQHGAVWVSEPEKNICVSFIYYPGFISIQRQFIISKAVALALRELVASCVDKPVYIKWPNDILVDHKKIAGILINNSIQGDKLVNTIIGIGLNVNQTNFPEVAKNATSLQLLMGQEFNLEDLVMNLQINIEKYYHQLIDKKDQEIDREYLQYLYGLNTPLSFSLEDGSKLEGSIIDVEDNGLLQIKTIEGIRSFSIKQIKFPL